MAGAGGVEYGERSADDRWWWAGTRWVPTPTSWGRWITLTGGVLSALAFCAMYVAGLARMGDPVDGQPVVYPPWTSLVGLGGVVVAIIGIPLFAAAAIEGTIRRRREPPPQRPADPPTR